MPFYHDPVVRYLERPYGDARDLTLERFHDELHSASFDGERGVARRPRAAPLDAARRRPAGGWPAARGR